MLLLELLCVAAALAIGLGMPAGRMETLRPLRRAFGRVARRRVTCVAAIAGGVFLFEAAMGWCVHLPVPALHDEFSYLLAGDTFAHGRLTNPTHPCWEHFESYNVIQQPSYQSKFPPAQGLALAIGQWLSSEPILGVWLTTAAACGAVCWMAYAWLPARWALTCGLLAAVNVKLLRFWGHSYMGGAVALLGGALVFGALPRLSRTWRTRDALLLATGLLLLANSRPYEGLIASLPAAGWLLAALVRRAGLSLRTALRHAIVPAAALLLAGFAVMAVYNQRVTGSPWRFPYQVWYETYQAGNFWTQTIVLADSREAMPDGQPKRVLGPGPTAHDWSVWFERRGNVAAKLWHQWQFYVGLMMTPGLLAALWTSRRRWRSTCFAAGTCGLVLTAICLQGTHGHPHYAAPIGGLLLVLIVQGLRNIGAWRWSGVPRGRWVAEGLVSGAIATSVLYVVLDWAPQPVLPPLAWSLERAELEGRLSRDPQADLVVVRYPSLQSTGVQQTGVEETGIHWNEWVYNRADIDEANVVWARDLGDQRNQQLLEYFAGRRVWLLDLATRRLTPLSAPTEPVPPVSAITTF